jgi:septal ring factor EnvC (AmiA/AmiB activator)
VTTEATSPNMTVCPSCATPTTPGEKFCGACGAVVTAASMTTATIAATAPVVTIAAPHTPTVAERDSAGAPAITRRRPSRLVILTAASIAIAVGLLIANDAGAHGQLSTTRRHLAATEATLTSTKGQLNSTKSSLASANATKAHLQTQLTSTQQQLAGVRGSLASTQNQLNLQAGQLAIVKTCLSGFATALNADLNGDYSSGLAALQSVQSACDEASKLFN